MADSGRRFVFAAKLALALVFAIFVFVFFTETDAVFAGRWGGRRRRVAGGFEFVVFGRVLRNAPRTSSSDCCALARYVPPATDSNTIAKMISLDISDLPLVTNPQLQKQFYW